MSVFQSRKCSVLLNFSEKWKFPTEKCQQSFRHSTDQRVRWRVTGNRAVDVLIVGILHLPNHQIVYKVQIIEHNGEPPNGQINLGIGTIHYIGVPPEATELSEIVEYSEGSAYACPYSIDHDMFSLTSELREHLTLKHGLKLPSYEELINDYVNGLHEVETV